MKEKTRDYRSVVQEAQDKMAAEAYEKWKELVIKKVATLLTTIQTEEAKMESAQKLIANAKKQLVDIESGNVKYRTNGQGAMVISISGEDWEFQDGKFASMVSIGDVSPALKIEIDK